MAKVLLSCILSGRKIYRILEDFPWIGLPNSCNQRDSRGRLSPVDLRNTKGFNVASCHRFGLITARA
jgi:hypothetical protein